MNAVIEAIRTRRTVKRFEAERFPARELLEQVIESATWAPNHHLTEPWRFVVVTGDARKRLGEALAEGLARLSAGGPAPELVEREKEKPLSAPVIVALISSPKVGESISTQEEIVAAGAALQNMLLAAHSLGLATSIRTGLHSYSEGIREFFGMQGDEKLIGMVYVGYATGITPPGKRTPFRDKVVWRES